MKYRLLLFLLFIAILSCARRNTLQVGKIVAVRPVFKDSSFNHRSGYYVGRELVSYDKHNVAVKEFLLENLDSKNAFIIDGDQQRISNMLAGKRAYKFYPIKVVPHTEFGYLEMADGRVLLYAIMGGQSLLI